jgi:hypothetical protein
MIRQRGTRFAEKIMQAQRPTAESVQSELILIEVS